MSLLLSEIYIYPIKSLGGISLQNSFVEDEGLRFDRRMMIVDESGTFLTQRSHPRMALIKTAIDGNSINVNDARTNMSLTIPFGSRADEKIIVKIWDDICSAQIVSKQASAFFSNILGLKCHLVSIPSDELRLVDKKKKYVAEDHYVGFADAYPFLIIGQSSIDDLNSRLDEFLPMNRFRPNFVFAGGEPFEEDTWSDFKIGSVKFRAAKPCERCVIPTTNQDTGERKDEPLKTLSTYRKFDNKVLFGMNLISTSTGMVSIGDKIELIK